MPSQSLFDQTAIKTLVSVGTYREFLAASLEIRKAKGRALSFAQIATKAGFKARSFPRDIIVGKKSLTLASAERVAKAIGLPRNLQKHLMLLVEAEEAKTRGSNRSTEQVTKLLHTSKSRLLQTHEFARADQTFAIEAVAKIYASLGSRNSGATLAETVSRSRVSSEVATLALEKLLSLGFVIQRNNKYFASETHLSLTQLGGSNAFQNLFKANVTDLLREAPSKFDDPDSLFFTSAFSVSRKSLPELTERLRDVLLEFIDQAEEGSGEDVVTLTCGLMK